MENGFERARLVYAGNDFEKNRLGYGEIAMGGGYLGLVSTVPIGYLSDEPFRDWKAKLSDLNAHVEKVRKDLHGPMHNLVAVDIAQTKQQITNQEAKNPGQFEGLHAIETMGGLVVAGAVAATAITYGIRQTMRGVRKLKET